MSFYRATQSQHSLKRATADVKCSASSHLNNNAKVRNLKGVGRRVKGSTAWKRNHCVNSSYSDFIPSDHLVMRYFPQSISGWFQVLIHNIRPDPKLPEVNESSENNLIKINYFIASYFCLQGLPLACCFQVILVI